MKLNKDLNIAALVIFIGLFVAGLSLSESLSGLGLMLLGGLGLLSQFILFNIVSMKNKNGQS